MDYKAKYEKAMELLRQAEPKLKEVLQLKRELDHERKEAAKMRGLIKTLSAPMKEPVRKWK